jgi:hypothetical protein
LAHRRRIGSVGVRALTGTTAATHIFESRPAIQLADLGMKNLELTDEQVDQLVAELDRIIEGDRYFLSPRITALRAIREQLKPYPAVQPAAAPQPRLYAPPT